MYVSMYVCSVFMSKRLFLINFGTETGGTLEPVIGYIGEGLAGERGRGQQLVGNKHTQVRPATRRRRALHFYCYYNITYLGT